MNIEWVKVLAVLAYFLIAVLVFLAICLWDRLSTRKVGLNGGMFCSVFWPCGIFIGAIWWLFHSMEIAYEKIANRK